MSQSVPSFFSKGHAGPQATLSLPLVSPYSADPLLGDLVRDFVRQLPQQLEDLVRELDQGDWKRVRKLSHRLCGEAATFGYKPLAEVARALEESTTKPEPDLFGSFSQQLLELYQRIAAGLGKEAT